MGFVNLNEVIWQITFSTHIFSYPRDSSIKYYRNLEAINSVAYYNVQKYCCPNILYGVITCLYTKLSFQFLEYSMWLCSFWDVLIWNTLNPASYTDIINFFFVCLCFGTNLFAFLLCKVNFMLHYRYSNDSCHSVSYNDRWESLFTHPIIMDSRIQ